MTSGMSGMSELFKRTSENLRNAFDALDADKSGRLQCDEMMALVSMLGSSGSRLGMESVSDMMQRAARLHASRQGLTADQADALEEEARSRGLDYDTFCVFAEHCLCSNASDLPASQERRESVYNALSKNREDANYASSQSQDVISERDLRVAMGRLGINASAIECMEMFEYVGCTTEMTRTQFDRLYDRIQNGRRVRTSRDIAVDVE